jgi:hypothetical protein
LTLTSYAQVFDDLADEISEISEQKGFWDYPWISDEAMIMMMKLALIHSEVSEALEVHRNFYDGEEASSISGMTPTQEQDFSEEMADAVIRILDVIGYYGLGEDFGDILVAKIEKNRDRPHKHGKRY